VAVALLLGVFTAAAPALAQAEEPASGPVTGQQAPAFTTAQPDPAPPAAPSPDQRWDLDANQPAPQGVDPRQVSGRNVDSVEVFYDSLAPYGDWINMPGYGWVWRPSGVPIGWRPYTNGRWLWSRYGWTWLSYDEWGWAPFHYGYWSWVDGPGWCWMPGTTWGPAWVSWLYAPGYIGWAPWYPGAYYGAHGGGLYGWGYNWWVFVPRRGFMGPVTNNYLPSHEVRRVFATASPRWDDVDGLSQPVKGTGPAVQLPGPQREGSAPAPVQPPGQVGGPPIDVVKVWTGEPVSESKLAFVRPDGSPAPEPRAATPNTAFVAERGGPGDLSTAGAGAGAGAAGGAPVTMLAPRFAAPTLEAGSSAVAFQPNRAPNPEWGAVLRFPQAPPPSGPVYSLGADSPARLSASPRLGAGVPAMPNPTPPVNGFTGYVPPAANPVLSRPQAMTPPVFRAVEPLSPGVGNDGPRMAPPRTGFATQPQPSQGMQPPYRAYTPSPDYYNVPRSQPIAPPTTSQGTFRAAPQPSFNTQPRPGYSAPAAAPRFTPTPRPSYSAPAQRFTPMPRPSYSAPAPSMRINPAPAPRYTPMPRPSYSAPPAMRVNPGPSAAPRGPSIRIRGR
jgi:hypothetical protein